MEYIVCQPDELYHVGVKGMKWGVRKSDKERAAEYRKRKAGKIEKMMIKALAKNERRNGGTKEGEAAARDIKSRYEKQIKSAMNMSMNDIRVDKYNNRKKIRRRVATALGIAAGVAITAVDIATGGGVRGLAKEVLGLDRYEDHSYRVTSSMVVAGNVVRTAIEGNTLQDRYGHGYR